MPRFVILRHDSPRGLHWDLLLETGEVLRAYALPQLPEPPATMTCEALADHRLIYLDYEGPISGGRGSVSRWESGVYDVVRETAEELTVDLHGDTLSGRATLRRYPEQTGQWIFSFLRSA